MRSYKLETWLGHWLPAGVAVILLLIPFHAIITVGLSQLVGHYTLLRLWKETLLLLLTGGAAYLVVRHRDQRQQILSSKLVWLIAAYLGLQLVWGLVAYLTHQVSAKAIGYGLISNSRYLIFFLDTWIIAAQATWLRHKWPRLLFWPATGVIAFGLLQYFVLPYNFLVHFGYSAATIFPYEDINHNVHYIRIMSTLRGANPLGAYLVVVLSLGLIWWYRCRQWWYGLMTMAGVIVLVLSFSRGAWLGFGLSVVVIVLSWLRSRRARHLAALSIALMICLMAGLTFGLRHNAHFQNIFFHTESRSAIATTSDQGHASALRSGLADVAREPLGRGPGTAGPASVYNTGHSSRIAENYFIQIVQETGWLGLALFLAINIMLGNMLWQRRAEPLAIGLLTALGGLTIVNLLSHAWADDTLAYIWWGLAAIAATLPLASAATKRPRDLTARGTSVTIKR